MSRKSRKYNVSNFLTDHSELADRNVEIWIDFANGADILSTLTEKDNEGNYIRRDRFYLILLEIFNHRYNEGLYAPEFISGKATNITAMKFKKHRGVNIRIYCKEFHENGKKIVMITVADKKSQKIDKKFKNIIESIGEYEYEFK